MARYRYGGTAADFVFATTSSGYLKLDNATITFWDAETGGTQHTDLLIDDVAATEVTVGADGQVPAFDGPDGVLKLWADAGGGRVLVTPSNPLETVAAADYPLDGGTI